MTDINLDKTYQPSDMIVAREIVGELIIVPLVSGIADMEDELFTLNETGKAIWDSLDGKTNLRAIVASLAEEYDADLDVIEKDVLGLVAELVARRMLVEQPAV